nr:hypothetical protein [Providencia rettgeri]
MLNQTIKHIHNIRLPECDGLWRIDIDNQKIQAIHPQPEGEILPNSLDDEAGLVTAPFVEPLFTRVPLKPLGNPNSFRTNGNNPLWIYSKNLTINFLFQNGFL